MSKAAPSLRYEFEAILQLNEQGINVLDPETLSEKSLRNPKTVFLLWWAGLLHSNPDLTPDDARVLMRGLPLGKVFKAISDALKNDLRKSEEDPAGDPQASK